MDTSLLLSNIVVLVAAFIGFGGVIYSQRRSNQQAADARAYAEQQARLRAEADAKAELVSVINALLGELAALQIARKSASDVLDAQIAIAEQLAAASIPRKTQPRVAFRFVTPVFDSHVARIGVLKPETSFRVSQLYGQLKAFAANSNDTVPEMDAAIASQVMQSVSATLAKLDVEIEELESLLRSQAEK